MAKEYIRNIIFTRTPLNGKYRYKDDFQIYPLNLPKAVNSKLTDHFPIIIEFWYDSDELPEVKEFEKESTNKWIASATVQTNKLIKITNLLSSITNFRFFFYRKPETFWAIPLLEKIEEKDYNETSSIWSASLYYYPEIAKDLKIDSLSDSNFGYIPLIPTKRYYWFNPVESKEKFIDLPSSINTTISKYFMLEGKELSVADSCIYQICNGIELYYNMKSLSFFSLVSAIETLVDYEFRNEVIEYECTDCKSLKSSERHCKKCGSPIWGVTSKFREFLLKYVSAENKAKQLYNYIYNIRSKITHTDYLINDENYLNWNFTDKTNEIIVKHLQTLQLARRSLIYWLQKKDT
jgi:hypothetical protein